MVADWFDELELGPLAHPVSMGTRSLGDRPWLVADDRRVSELAYKQRLLDDRRNDVLWLTDEAIEPARSLARRLGVELTDDMHPLESIARGVQEDVCLLRRDEASGHWLLDASVICFPSYWRLQDKVARSMAAVHGPVDSYDPRIIDKVDRLFDRLTERPVWRRNWNLTDDWELFHPQRRDDDPAVPADRTLTELLVRSERQVLAAVANGWLVFTIRVQIETLDDLLGHGPERPGRIERLRRYVAEVLPDLASRRHLGEPQRIELLQALDERNSMK